MMNTFQITQEIEQVFPDIQGELCSKHAQLLNYINKSFSKTYPSYTPTHFVIAKQTAVLAAGCKYQLSMAMQQGVTIMLSIGLQGEHINISSPLCDQITLQSSGKVINFQIEEGLTSLASKAISLAAEDLSLNKTMGGFVYIHFHQNAKLHDQSTKNSIIIGMFMVGIILNGLQGQYSLSDLIQKLRSLEEFRDNQIVQNYFHHYCNRQLLVSGNTFAALNFDKKYKFLFMTIKFIAPDFEILPQALQNSKFDPIIYKFVDKQLDIQQIMNQIQQIQTEMLTNQALIAFVSKMKIDLKIKANIYTQKYCIFLVQNYRYAEIIGKISKLIHSILAQRQNKQDNGQLINKNYIRARTQSILFSSVPSNGVSVLDPTNAMWF